jgi:hypothetical protein
MSNLSLVGRLVGFVKHDDNAEAKKKPAHPISCLEGRADELLEMYYLDYGASKMEKGYARNYNESGVMFGTPNVEDAAKNYTINGVSYDIQPSGHFSNRNIDNRKADGKRCAIYQIKDSAGEVIYSNPNMQFDEAAARKYYEDNLAKEEQRLLNRNSSGQTGE